MKALLLTVALLLLGLVAALGDDLRLSERKLLATETTEGTPCPDGEYKNKKGKCKKCKVFNCKKCTGNKGQTCIECKDGFELSGNNRCPRENHKEYCPDGKWLDARKDKCRKCKTKNCRRCVAAEGRKCLECLSGYTLVEGQNKCKKN